MTWGDEVHSTRYHAAVANASAERRLRRRGLPVPVMGTAKAGPVLAMVALASGLVVWQQWGPLARRVLARNPWVQQVRALVFGPGSRTAGRPVASKAGGKGGTTTVSSNSSSSGSKASARKPTLAAAAAPQTPAAAAAAAAESRITAAAAQAASPRGVPPVPVRPAQTDPQPQASTSAAQLSFLPPQSSSAPGASASSAAAGSAGGGSKKKKSGKKRR